MQDVFVRGSLLTLPSLFGMDTSQEETEDCDADQQSWPYWEPLPARRYQPRSDGGAALDRRARARRFQLPEARWQQRSAGLHPLLRQQIRRYLADGRRQG